MRELSNKAFGALGEKTARKYLKKQGYKILEKNYTTPFGEVDIIASRGDIIAFVEVKTRSASPAVSGVFAVDAKKREHIMRVSSLYMTNCGITLQPRFDIIEVEMDRAAKKPVSINHYENAYQQTGEYGRF